MTMPPSPIGIAVDAVAARLEAHFLAIGAQVGVTMETPAAAQALARTSDRPVVNLFFYRMVASIARSRTLTGQPMLLTLCCLATAFDVGEGASGDATEVWLLGEVVRYFHAKPMLSSLPNPPIDGMPRYTVTIALGQVSTEEMYHIWSTQGPDVPYRLSIGYEIAAIPVEPLAARPSGPLVVASTQRADVSARPDTT